MRTTSPHGLAVLPVLFACIGSLASAACGGAPDREPSSEDTAGTEIGRQTSAIQDGTSDTKAAHNFAVGIVSRYNTVCSGTLIAPNLVLTARHCVVPPTAEGAAGVTCSDTFPKANVSPGDLFVTTSPNLLSAKKRYAAKKITTPTDRGFCGNDIALITLQSNVPESEAEPAIPVVQFAMSDRSRIGGTIAALGYGITSPSANDSGIRRIHEDISIVCVPGDDSYACKGSYKSMVDSEAEFVTEGFVCSGDSGGGAFDQATFTEGAPYVLGALSRGPQTDDRCLAAIYSRTDAHADLIIAAGLEAAEAGGYDPPGWTSSTIEPSTAPEPSVANPSCEGETCTATDATEPEAPAESAVMVKKTTTGCAVARGPASPTNDDLAAVGLAGIVGLAVRRRRAASEA